MKRSTLLALISVVLIPQFSWADVVSYGVSGTVVAELANVSSMTATLTNDIDSASLLLVGSGATENSRTTSSLDYNWDGTTLTGTGFINTEKIIPAKPGGLHQGESTLTFNFNIVETSRYVLEGNFGYVKVTSAGEADTVSWSLSGTPLSGGSYSASGTANAVSELTVHEQLFSQADIITAGSYTLVLTANFHETVNNPESRQAGWEITSFTVPAYANVPEPGSCFVLGCCTLAVLCRRRRTQ